MNGRAAMTSTPSSSRSSRLSAACSLSPVSTLPPGNSQRPASALPVGRCAISTRPSPSKSAPATTSTEPRTALGPTTMENRLLDARERAVTVLVLLPRAARAGLVASHLALAAHEGAGSLRWWQRRRAGRSGTGRTRSTPFRRRWQRTRRRLGTTPVSGERRGGFGVLRLQRAHQPAVALLFFALDLLLGAHLDGGNEGHGLVFDALEHGGEHLERLALELETIVLLRVAAQVNALAQVVHGCQVLAPVLVELAQHDLLFHVAHDRRADPRHLGVVGLVQGAHDALAQRFGAELRLLLQPEGRVDAGVEIALHRCAQCLEIPVLLGGLARQVLIEQRTDRVLHQPVNGVGEILGPHDLRALRVDHLTLIVGHVVEQQQVLADVEVVRLDLALRLLDLAGEHAALDDLAFLHAGHLQQALRAQRVAEDAHEVIFHRQIETARARVALPAGSAAQLVVDAARFVALGTDDVESAGADHLVVPSLPFRAQ